MTIIYKPVLIESAEQAEALPIGTYAKNEETTPSGTWYAPPRVNIGRGMWSGDDLYRSSDMVGWTALMPIEAEEQTAVDPAGLDLDPEHEYWSDDPDLIAAIKDAPKKTRLVTSWEEA